MNFKGLVFDFDGTITDKGVHYPDQEMVEILCTVAQGCPIACCTGRQLDSFVRHGLNYFVDGSPKHLLKGFLRNLHLMAENGAIGYFYDEEKEDFEEFYQAKWPVDLVDRFELMEVLDEAVREFGSVYYDAHKVVVVVRTSMHEVPKEERNIERMYELSDRLYEIICEVLRKINEGYEDFLHVGNSGIGVVVGPALGDKDFGVRKFGEYLRERRGVVLDDDLRDLLVIGDRPQRGGNDHYLLNGKLGTPFTVGDLVKEARYPLPVLDDCGLRLLNASGTKYLLKKYFGV